MVPDVVGVTVLLLLAAAFLAVAVAYGLRWDEITQSTNRERNEIRARLPSPVRWLMPNVATGPLARLFTIALGVGIGALLIGVAIAVIIP